MADKTLREYFTKHPKFNADGKLQVIDTHTMSYCEVPFDAAIWEMLKRGKLDEPIPPESLARLETL